MPARTMIATMTIATALVLAVGVTAYVWTGAYDVAADDEHTQLIADALTTVREKSVQRRAEGIVIPNLSGTDRIAAGAREYAEMCVICHRSPGAEASDLARGLNPRPPDLTRHAIRDAAEAFWVIKHGIKMTGMPAWGQTHDDPTLWDIVAFLQQLPRMSPEQYRQLAGQKAAAESHLGHGATMQSAMPKTGRQKGGAHSDEPAASTPPHARHGQ